MAYPTKRMQADFFREFGIEYKDVKLVDPDPDDPRFKDGYRIVWSQKMHDRFVQENGAHRGNGRLCPLAVGAKEITGNHVFWSGLHAVRLPGDDTIFRLIPTRKAATALLEYDKLGTIPEPGMVFESRIAPNSERLEEKRKRGEEDRERRKRGEPIDEKKSMASSAGVQNQLQRRNILGR